MIWKKKPFRTNHGGVPRVIRKVLNIGKGGKNKKTKSKTGGGNKKGKDKKQKTRSKF